MAGLIHRRTFLRGLFAAPAIVAAHNLMPVRGYTLVDLNQDAVVVPRWLYVVKGGDVSMLAQDGKTLTFRDVPSGAILPIEADYCWGSAKAFFA